MQIPHSSRAPLMSSRGSWTPSEGSSPCSIPKRKSLAGLGRPQTGDPGACERRFHTSLILLSSLGISSRLLEEENTGSSREPAETFPSLFFFHQDEILLSPWRESPIEDTDSFASPVSSAPSASAVSPAQLREETNPRFPCSFPVLL